MCQRMPLRTSSVRLRSIKTSTTRRLWALCWKPPGTQRASACSPVWPKAGWPRSWPMQMASIRSSLSRRARPMDRDTWDTSRVWVSRVR
ncbi:hypothetical protein D3C87_1922870 [compost metagenome]